MRLARQWALQAAYTYLNAEFREGEFAGRGRRPACPSSTCSWASTTAPPQPGASACLAQHAGKVYVNDANKRSRAGLHHRLGQRGLHPPARRLDAQTPLRGWTTCSTARRVGSVIVNDGNSRYYESAPGPQLGRTGVSLRYNF